MQNIQTKCINHKECNGNKNWTLDEFKKSETDSEKIKVMLCDSCLQRFNRGPIGIWFPLKNSVENFLKGAV